MNKLMYCALCWQSFDRTEEHNVGSYFNSERLNGHCRGDIRYVERPVKRPHVSLEVSSLPLDIAPPIVLK